MGYTPWIYYLAHKKIKEAVDYQRPWLILERLGLEELPEEVFDLTHIDELVVIDNLLTSIPPDIGKLKNLTRLSFFYNEISIVPPEIGQLENLTHLDLSCNCLESLPIEIKELKNLEYLDLRYNKLPISSELLEQVFEPQSIISNYLETLQPVG